MSNQDYNVTHVNNTIKQVRLTIKEASRLDWVEVVLLNESGIIVMESVVVIPIHRIVLTKIHLAQRMLV